MKLDNDLSERIHELAKKLNRPPESVLRDAIEQYGPQARQTIEPQGHPSGKPWPRSSPVGGIITPV